MTSPGEMFAANSTYLSGTSLNNISLEGKLEKLNSQDEHTFSAKKECTFSFNSFSVALFKLFMFSIFEVYNHSLGNNFVSFLM